MLSLVEKIVAVHNALEKAKLPHAFGGALALAWCTEQARGTIDIDVNILVDVSQSELILGSLPKAVTWTPQNLERRSSSTVPIYLLQYLLNNITI